MNYTYTVHLNIASLNFEITGQTSTISQNTTPPYRQFHCQNTDPGTQSLQVTLHHKKEMPDIAAFHKVFDTSQSWFMLSDSQNKYIIFQPPGRNEPKWLAIIHSDQKKVDIYCDSEPVNPSAPNQKILINPVCYPLDQILLINLLVGKGLLIHAAGIVIDGKGYLFAGPSGAGKSTICSLLNDANNLTILSDDRIVVDKVGHEFLIFGTPWPGDAGIAVNESARLHGIFFLQKSADDSIRELNGAETLNYLFKVASLPLYDETDMQKSLDFCEELLKEVKTYELHFKPGQEIVKEVVSFVTD